MMMLNNMVKENHTKNTKIVCTIGPSSDKKEVLDKLIENGMNVMRLNFSHGTYEEHLKKIELARSYEKDGIYTMEMDIPGFNREDVKIEVDDNDSGLTETQRTMIKNWFTKVPVFKATSSSYAERKKYHRNHLAF